MNYIYVSFDAISEITSTHKLQSADFNESATLCQAIRGEISHWTYGFLYFRLTPKGGFFFSRESQVKKGVVFDLSTFLGFQNAKDEIILTVFQKVLKFAIRYFAMLPSTSCEKHIADNKAIVFPFPFLTAERSYRILIDKKPDVKRLEKRDKQFLFVYAAGTSDNITLSPNYFNLTKAIEEASEVCKGTDSINGKEKTPEILSLSTTSLDKNQELSINENIGFDNWNHYLTNMQREFVYKDILGPERLEGAAGTGKTLIMILRCINLLRVYKARNEILHLVFVTHSISTKNQVEEIFRANCPEYNSYIDRTHSNNSIIFITLQEWCISFLGSDLGTTEYLDRDAQDSKFLQKMYLEDAFDKALREEFNTYKLFCSPEFVSFLTNSPREHLVEMLQHEVSVTIKGRASENLEKFKTLPRLKYSIPCKNEGDLNFLYFIFSKYQDALKLTNQFDSDDIVLTALGQLNTPIWRRRREKDAFSCVFVDETHLFNLNELSIIHNLTNQKDNNNIIFTIDKSQAVGDRGLVDDSLFEALGLEGTELNSSRKLRTIFRSSPEIVNVAFNILANAATLFTNFENPIDKVSFNFIEKNDKISKSPIYFLKENDDQVIIEAFNSAERLKKELNSQNSKILIVACTEMIFSRLEKYSRELHKPVELLKSRGDIQTVNLATKTNRFLIAGIDFVGGLEFDAVVIVGVDKGRVPLVINDDYSQSFHFNNYSWHNKMYVAVTRAKYAVVFIGDKTRGVSSLLESSIANGSVLIG